MAVGDLLHPSLGKFPQSTRFIIAGGLINVLFLLMHENAISAFEATYDKVTIYAGVSACFTPLSHLINVLLVFGWPANYVSSLVSMIPVQISNVIIGSFATKTLEQMNFDDKAKVFFERFNITNTFDMSSVVILVVTGVWSFALTTFMMSAGPKKKSKTQ